MKNKFWAMEPSAVTRYRKFKAQFSNITSAQLNRFKEKLQKRDIDELTIVDGVAVILIRGILDNSPSFFSFLYDGYADTYSVISRQIQSAEANSMVTQIQLRVNSPGGRLEGLFDLLYVIKSATKPVEAVVEARADSAAYGIVSQADKIVASSEISEVGSVGVGTSFWVDEEIVDITSSDAPNKWPDVTTSEGIDVVKAELDEIHGKFAGIIAEGRSAATGKKITIDDVNSKYGQGGTMLAEAAFSAGMLDEIIPAPDRVSNADFFQKNAGPNPSGFRSEETKTKKTMDLQTFKEKYPDVYEAAVKSERDRVAALLVAGKSSGKMDYAVECIKDGSRISDDLVQANFLASRLNEQDVETRDNENPDDLNPPADGADELDEEKAVKGFLERRKKRRGK